MNEFEHNVGLLVSKIIQEAMASGLSWDESVAALGVAAKALADIAAKNGDGSPDDCQAHAQKRLAEGFARPVGTVVVFATADLSQLKQACVDDPAAVDATLANTNTRAVFKLH